MFHGALDVRLDLPLASVGSRMVAQLVDMMLSLGVGLLVVAFIAAGGIVASVLGSEEGALIALLVGLIALFALQWGWFFFFEWLWEGQTPGKRMLGLRVVTSEGAPPGLWASLVRNLIRIVDLLPGAYGIGAITMLLGREGKRLGDLAAGTVVVREEQARGPAPAPLPDGLDDEAAALLQHWRRRAPSLLPAVRREQAARLVGWLSARHPGLLGPADLDPTVEPEAALAALFDEAAR